MGIEAANPIQSTKTSFAILDHIAEHNSATLAEITAAVELSQGAVYNHLATLQELGMVSKTGSTYHLNHRLLRYVAPLKRSTPGIVTAQDKLNELADTSGEFATLLVYDGDSMIVVDSVAGENAKDDLRIIGESLPIHSTAGGRAVLASMGEAQSEEVCRQIAAGVEIDLDGLLDEVKTARAQGIAFSRGEHRGEYSVATALDLNEEDRRYAISVTGPGDRLSGKALQQDVAGLVVRAANISNNSR